MVIANVVVAGIIEPAGLHLVRNFGDVTGLELWIRRRIAQSHVPLVQKSFGVKRRVFGDQCFHAIDGAANAHRIAVIDVP